MKRKIKLDRLVWTYDDKHQPERFNKSMANLGRQTDIIFGTPSNNTNEMLWDIPGEGWHEIDDSPEAQAAAPEAKARIDRAIALIGDRSKALLTIPGLDCIFFRPKAGGGYDIAVIAWGYRYENDLNIRNIWTGLRFAETQEVEVAFDWDGEHMPNCHFRTKDTEGFTNLEGIFNPGGALLVGRQITFFIGDKALDLTVEKGRRLYAFDMTERATVDVTATLDDAPLASEPIELTFGDKTLHTITDSEGHASFTVPLVHRPDTALAADAQPAIRVACRDKEYSRTPAPATGTIAFTFAFTTPKSVVPDPPVPPVPDPPVPPVPEPKMITISLLDYGGVAMPDLPFELTTPRNGKVSLTTDANGCVALPAEWFEDKKKMKFHLKITPEYQAAHDDLHFKSGKKKKDKKS